MIVGAAVSVEIWRPEAWIQYLNENMADFNQLFNDLAQL